MKIRRSTFAGVTATVALGALVLTGCSSTPVLEASDPMSGEQSPQSGEQSGEISAADSVVLTEEQVLRIVGEIQGVLDKSSEEDDPKVLESRVSNPALAMREGQLVRSEKTDTELSPLEITPEVFSATAGDSWPRVLIVASNAVAEDPAELFIITQEDARGDYKLENWSRLIGGTSVRGVSVRDGSKVLASDAAGLKVTPEEALSAYVGYLNTPKDEKYQIFEDEVFAPHYREELKSLNAAVKVAGNVKAKAEVGDYPVTAVQLNTGDALVSTAFTYETIYTRTVPRSTFEMAGTPASYLEDKNVIGSVTVDYLVSVFFLVPQEGSDEPISVVGSERVITGVDRDDTEPSAD